MTIESWQLWALLSAVFAALTATRGNKKNETEASACLNGLHRPSQIFGN